MIELYEEEIEKWYFNYRKSFNLTKYLCEDLILKYDDKKCLSEKESKKAMADMEKNQKRIHAQQAKELLKASANKKQTLPDDELFSAEGTQLLGKDRIILLTKVKQWKNLFPDKLKGFKIKRNPSLQELQQYLEEMQVLVDVSSVDEFITDSIFQCIKVVEGVTANTKNYNIRYG